MSKKRNEALSKYKNIIKEEVIKKQKLRQKTRAKTVSLRDPHPCQRFRWIPIKGE